MASKIEPTPVLEGDDARRFIEKLETPSTPEEIKFLEEADEIFKKIKFIKD